MFASFYLPLGSLCNVMFFLFFVVVFSFLLLVPVSTAAFIISQDPFYFLRLCLPPPSRSVWSGEWCECN